MKTLYIVRHAKSSWDNPEFSDHERPLMQKGVRKTAKISQYLSEMDVEPDMIISSTAVRAYETACLIAKALHYPVDKIQKEAKLYLSDSEQILNLIFGVDNKHKSLMIFGHNPTFTSFANQFLSEKIDWMPTSAVVAVKFDTDNWEDLCLSDKQLKFVVFPKMLK